MKVWVEIDEEEREVGAGTTVAEVLGAERIAAEQLVAATVDNHLVGLDAPLHGDTLLRPIAAREPLGEGVVKRSVAHMFMAVAHERFPELILSVGQSLLGGHFYEVEPEQRVAELELIADELSQALRDLSAEALPFERRALSCDAASRDLSDPGSSKRRLLCTLPAPVVATASLKGFADLQHGPYAPDTGCGAGAEVVAYPPGLILRFPGARPLPGALAGRRLFQTYRKARDWNRRVGVSTVADLNEAVLEGRIGEVVNVAEALQEKELASIADDVAARAGEVRLVCVAGPSSSGKSTFVRRLSTQLRVNGIKPIVLSLDDYYRDRDECPLDAEGQLDFEALEALDLDLLHEHLEDLVVGREVHVPGFDFRRGKPTPRDTWRPLRLERDQLLLLEGIHGLNPALTGQLPASAEYRVYLNALTQLQIDAHNRIQTSEGRLLRRIVRDRCYRGTNAAETIQRWASVRRGERAHIFPFEDEADRVFNTALVYEVAVLRTYAWRFLLEVPRSHPSRTQAYRLLRFLELFVPVLGDAVPANSVLREFIGPR